MASTIKGINVVIGAETTGLSKALSDVNKRSRDIQKELRQVDRLLKFNPKNTELLAQKQKLLGDQVKTTKEKLDALKRAQAQVNEQFKKGEISEEQYRAFQREIVQTESKLKHFEKQLGSTKKSLDQVGQSLQGAGRKMTDIGKNMSMKVTAPLVGLGAVAIKTGMDFEAAMSEVGAISGATGADLQALENLAKEMGATTKFSASEAAEGLKYMAMAGWDTQQQLDGLPGILNLAAASGEDLGAVSDIVTDAMTAFGMEAARAGEFADTLAAAASSSNTNVGMLGESFKYVAPLAGALGYTANDTAIALGLMANAGIKGSQSGTAMRSILTRLAKPTKESGAAMEELGISLTNTDGSMKSLAEIMGDLRGAFRDLDPEQKAFYAAQIAGQEAMSGLLAIVNTSEEDFSNLSDSINNSTGAAERMSKEMQDNLKGRIIELKSAIEGVVLQFYEAMLPALEAVVAAIQKLVDWLANLSPEIKTIMVVVAALAAAIGPLRVVLGMMAQGLGAVLRVASTLAGALPALGTVFAALAGPIGIAVAALAGLTAGGIALYKYFSQDAIPTVQLFGDEVSQSTQEAVGGFLKLNDEATKALNQLAWSGQEVTKEMADNITGNVSKMASQVQSKLDEHHKKSLVKIEGFVSNSTALSKEEQEEIISNVKQGHESRKKVITDGENRIKEILITASNEKRAITKEEQEEINSIQQQMVETGIQVLSENEVESKAIMERMKAQAGEITAAQAAEVVKNSLEQKEGAVEAAEEQYNEVIKEIIRQRDEAGTISEEQAEKLIEEATRQKDESIAHAEEMHQKVVDEAKAQADEHVNHVDWETGEVKTRWQAMKADIAERAEEIKNNTLETWENVCENSKAKWDEIRATISEKAGATREAIIQKWIEVSLSTIEVWKGLKDNAVTWGANITQGLADGITSMIERARDAAVNVATSVRDSIKKLLGIASPSKVMVEFGQRVSEGLAVGIKDKANKIDKEMQKIVNAIKSASQTMLDDLSMAIQLTNAKFDLQIAKLGKTATETDKLRIEMQRLQAQVNNTRERIEVLTAAYEKSKEELGENAEQTKGYYLELIKAQTELIETEAAIKDTTKAVEYQTSETKKLESKLKDLAYQMDIQKTKHDIEKAALGDSATEQRKYSLEVKQAEERLVLLEEKLDLVTQAYEASKKATGETSEKTKELYKELLQAELAYTSLASQIGITTDKYKDQAAAARDAADAAKDAANVPTPSPPQQGSDSDSDYNDTSIARSNADIPGFSNIAKFYKKHLDIDYIDEGFYKDYNKLKAQGEVEDWDTMWIYDYLSNGTVKITWKKQNGRWYYSSIQKMADGGIVTQPTMSLIGEAGQPEAVLPLPKLQPMMTEALLGAVQTLGGSSPVGIDYDRLGKAVADHVKPSVHQTNKFYSPKPLTPSETARKNIQVSRALAMEWGL